MEGNRSAKYSVKVFWIKREPRPDAVAIFSVVNKRVRTRALHKGVKINERLRDGPNGSRLYRHIDLRAPLCRAWVRRTDNGKQFVFRDFDDHDGSVVRVRLCHGTYAAEQNISNFFRKRSVNRKVAWAAREIKSFQFEPFRGRKHSRKKKRTGRGDIGDVTFRGGGNEWEQSGVARASGEAQGGGPESGNKLKHFRFSDV